MSFQKVGMLKTARVEVLNDLSSWGTIKKQAKILPTTIDETTKEAVDKEADFQIVAAVDTEKFIYIHTTIMAGVKNEDNGFWITSATEKFINDNNDAWANDDLLSDYKTFKRATTFVEHDQRLENAKGKCIDVIARDMGDTYLIDVLFSVDRRHKDLVANIESGIINAVSMGCTTAKTVCSICGNVASDPEAYCEHLKQGNKGRQFRCSDGKNRRAAEICKNNTFFDVSLVANPAFAGAVFRKILSSSEISNHLLANILNSKIEAMAQEDGVMLKAASSNSEAIKISIKQNGSIEINTPTQIFTTHETLSTEEIEKISAFIKQEEKQPSMIDKVLQTLFGKKEATHPILNQSPKKDFSISDQDYSDIQIRNRHNVLNHPITVGIGDKTPTMTLDIMQQPQLDLKTMPIVMLEILPQANKETESRLEEFECIKCGFQSDLWKIRASSIDAGHYHTLECPRCFYIAEDSLFKTAKTKRLFKIKEQVIVTSKKDKGQAGIIVAFRGPLYVIKLDKGNKVVWKSENDLKKVEKKASIFVANQDIPIENDEGTFWFDEQGNSVLTKGEKLAFVTTVDNGEYGLFVTETGEDFFMPMSYVNSQKKIG
jgi:hypothetical protein